MIKIQMKIINQMNQMMIVKINNQIVKMNNQIVKMNNQIVKINNQILNQVRVKKVVTNQKIILMMMMICENVN